MDIILNKIPDEYENNKTLWIYQDNIPLFEKYNQTSQIKTIKPATIIQEVPKEVPMEIPMEVPKDVINKPRKVIEKQTPLNLIINKTFTADVMKNEVRQKLIDFVTEPEFSKAFGSKKSGEIVSAIMRDSWNQSTALFISFLLDANVIYKDKSYLYNKDKNKEDILIAVK
jgi:hypothetical protein